MQRLNAKTHDKTVVATQNALGLKAQITDARLGSAEVLREELIALSGDVVVD
jgi:hypothetical protein